MEKISTIPKWGTWWFAVAMSCNPTSKLKKINKAVGWSDEWMLEDENTPKKESYKKGIDIEKYKDKIKITEIVFKKI